MRQQGSAGATHNAQRALDERHQLDSVVDTLAARLAVHEHKRAV